MTAACSRHWARGPPCRSSLVSAARVAGRLRGGIRAVAEQSRTRVALAEGPRQLVDGLLLLSAEMLGNVDHEAVVDVTFLRGARAELRRALAAQPLDGAARRAGRDAQRLRAVQRRHLHVGAAQRLRDRQRHLDLEVVALALERRRAADLRDQVQVTGGAAVSPRLALAGNPDAAAVLDAGGDVQ